MTLKQINSILRRHAGAKAKIARQLGVSRVSVTQALGGRMVSARIVEAARALAIELSGGRNA